MKKKGIDGKGQEPVRRKNKTKSDRVIKQADLNLLLPAAAEGEIRLLYLDETGFDSWSLSYSWSKIGSLKRQQQSQSRRISLMGLWEMGQEMIYGLSFGSVKGQTYVQMMQWLALRAASRCALTSFYSYL